MKKVLTAIVILVISVLTFAKETLIRDIPYYSEQMEKTGNIEYLNERCKLDIYTPQQNDSSVPVVIFLHGGGLTGGSKHILDSLKNSNLVIVAPNYRLSGTQAQAPDYLYDTAAAVAWTLDNIKNYGGNPEMVFLSGYSGGGYLAAMVGMDEKYLKKFNKKTSDLAGLLLLSAQMTTHFQIQKEQENPQTKVAIIVNDYAPMTHVKKALPPVRLYTGDPKIEWPSRAEENMLMASLLQRVAKHNDTMLYVFPSFDHGNVHLPAIQTMKMDINKILEARLLKAIPPLNERRSLKITPMGKTNQVYELLNRDGSPSSTKSQVYASYDDKNLYLNFDFSAKTNEKIKIGESFWDGDCIEIFIAKNNNSKQWIISPNGKLSFLNWQDSNAKSSATVTAQVEQDFSKYQAQLIIPWSDLGVTLPELNQLRFNIYRYNSDGIYSNFTPTMIEKNNMIEAFTSIRL